MNAAVQSSIVAVLVLAATLYAAWLLLSARSRLRVLKWLLRALPSAKNNGWSRTVLLRMTNRISRQLEIACHRCAANIESRQRH